MYYIPILGALALASGTLLERMVLKKRQINTKLYLVAMFLATTLVMLPIIYFFWGMQSEALLLKNILIFGLVIAISIIANLFLFYSLKWEKLSNLEPALILEPLFVILLAIVFSFIFGTGLYDRNYNVIIPAVIAAGALVLSHIKKHHIKFNKYFLAAALGSLFFGLELIITRLILDFYTPISFYFLRCSVIAVISLIIFRPNFKYFNQKTDLLIILTAAFWVAYRAIVYWGYIELGIVFTTLMVMLGPVFVYIFAHFFLKEKLHWRNILAAIVIICCVVYAVLV